MTCIVGIVTADGVLIAGDSCGSTRHTSTARLDSKTFALPCAHPGAVAVGITGSYRMSQVMHVHLPTLKAPIADEWAWSVREFIPALRATLSEHGAQRKEHDVESIDDGAFLLAVNARLFHVSSDYQVGESARGYDAAGSGTEVAIGSLYTSLRTRTRPEVYVDLAEANQMARTAIQAAEEHTPWVRSPVTTITTTNPKKER